MEKEKKPFYKKWWFIAIIALLVIGAIGNALESDESKQKKEDDKLALEQKKEDDKLAIEQKKEDDKAKAQKIAKEKKAAMTPKEKVVKIVTDKLGKTNNSKKDRIVEADVFEPGDGTRNIILTMNASENLTNNFIKRSMWMDSVDILEPLSKTEGLKNISIEWLYPLTDQYGNTEDKRIMMLNISKETLDKINWEDFNNENLPNVSTEYFEHPTLNK